MRASDLALDDLLEFRRDGGILRFVGERALILDTYALGLLRKELIETLGLDASRRVMTRFGYAHGWRAAELLERALPWASVDDWRRAGERLHRLRGMVSFEPVHESARAEPPALVEGIWRDSYEAEQHLRHFGEAEVPVCWSLSGFASGYLSRVSGRSVYCVETQCCGRGDALCRMRADEREHFVAHALEHELDYYEPRELDDYEPRELDYYEPRELDDSLARGRLRELERRLRAGFSPAACETLLVHDGPGDLRERQNVIERASALAHGELIEPQELPRLEPRPRDSGDLGASARTHATDHRRLDMSLAAVEREHILSVLDASGGNKAEAARRLGIGTATLFRKLKRYRG
ncbi:MAG: XylR N-terminal domain-containing protein [Enhygromyxa sp.]